MFDFFFFFIDIHEWLFYVHRKTSTLVLAENTERS